MRGIAYEQALWDEALIAKYDTGAPRYTSYPTAKEFSPSFNEQYLRAAYQKYPYKNLSLYFHIPFCHQLCYFCACNKVITQHQGKADQYLTYLALEIKARSQLLAGRQVTQIHLGGGSPTFLDRIQMHRLIMLIYDHFQVKSDAEIGIEIDPRGIDQSYLAFLRNLGFNRLSMGIQDFNPEVQMAVNREQKEEEVGALIGRAKDLGFVSVSVDLIYGLPLQTVGSFRVTLNKIIDLAPDRVSVFNFAYLPGLIKPHKMIAANTLPSAADKLKMFEETITLFTRSGYRFIGMDHFALEQDELAVLQEEGKLHRNFQGYTTQGDTDLVGLGVSAISTIGDTYAQNEKIIQRYYARVEESHTALARGLFLSEEDCLRRDIIKAIVCDFSVSFARYEQQHHFHFQKKFAHEMEALEEMAEDGLVRFTKEGFIVTPKGRLLVRHIALVFDQYSNIEKESFSRVI